MSSLGSVLSRAQIIPLTHPAWNVWSLSNCFSTVGPPPKLSHACTRFAEPTPPWGYLVLPPILGGFHLRLGGTQGRAYRLLPQKNTQIPSYSLCPKLRPLCLHLEQLSLMEKPAFVAERLRCVPEVARLCVQCLKVSTAPSLP